MSAQLASAAGGDEADVVARVNGTPITQAMVNQVVKSLILERGATPSSDEIATLSDAALASLVDLELLFQAAQKEPIRVTDHEVQAEIARSKARVGSNQAFAAALQRSGMTEAELAADTRKTLMVDRLVEQRVTNGVRVAPDAVRRFYDEHPQDFQHGEQARLRELFIRVAAGAPASERSKARQLADQLHGRLHGGADFSRFARSYPVDDATAAHGGDRGFVDHGALPPAVDQAAFSLPIGRLSGVIETPDGYHLIEVTERRPAGVLPFEAVRPGLEQALVDAERRQRQQSYLDDLRKTARIELPTPVKGVTSDH